MMKQLKNQFFIGMEVKKMNKFKQAVRAALDKNNPTQCKCPSCQGIVFLRYNDFTGGAQAMCEGCGKYWIEGVEESAE